MGKRNFKLHGADDLLKHLEEAVELEGVKEVVKLNTTELERNMIRDAGTMYKGHTGSKGKLVKPTGATKRSVPNETKYSDKGMTGRVSAGTHYFPYLELGTRFMTARPILRHNFYQQAMKFKNDINKLVK